MKSPPFSITNKAMLYIFVINYCFFSFSQLQLKCRRLVDTSLTFTFFNFKTVCQAFKHISESERYKSNHLQSVHKGEWPFMNKNHCDWFYTGILKSLQEKTCLLHFLSSS